MLRPDQETQELVNELNTAIDEAKQHWVDNFFEEGPQSSYSRSLWAILDSDNTFFGKKI